jgi:uncharacterized repeat protein (TIGR01451 family)
MGLTWEQDRALAQGQRKKQRRVTVFVQLVVALGMGLLGSALCLLLASIPQGVHAAPAIPTALLPRPLQDSSAFDLHDTTTTAVEPDEPTHEADSPPQGIPLAAPGDADLILTKGHSPEVVAAGERVSFTLVVLNTSLDDAISTTVTDTLHPSVTLLSATPGYTSPDARTLVWDLGTLAGGLVPTVRTITVAVQVDSDASVSVKNIAIAKSATNDPDLSNNVDTDTVILTKRSDLAVDKRDTPDPVVASQSLTYTITITNNGPSDVASVVVTDALPVGVTVSSVQPATSTQNSQTLVWNDLGPLGAGVTRTVLVELAVDRDVTGTITNTVLVGGIGTDPDTTNNQYTQSTLVLEQADIAIAKSAYPDPVRAGETLTYTLTVTNYGPLDAKDATISDTLPAGVGVTSVTPMTNAQIGQTLVWNLGTLSDGSSQTYVVVVVVGSDLTTTLDNAAVVTSTTPDPDAANNQAIQSTQVNTAADLAMSKTDRPDPVAASQTLTYTLSVVNNGPSDAAGLIVTDTLPLSVTVTTVQPPTDTQNGRTLIWNSLGTLPSGHSRAITVVLKVDDAFVGTITNAAGVTATTADPDTGDNVTTEDTTVTPVVDLHVLKTAALPATLTPGDTITYTIVVSNTGAANATGAVVFDPLPPGTHYLPNSIQLDPPTAGTAGTQPPTLATALTITAGQQVTLSFAVTVALPITALARITNAVAVTSAQALTPVSATLTATVRGADLAIAKSGTPTTAIPGLSVVTYTIVVSNVGPSHVLDATVADVLPTDLVAPTWRCIASIGSTCSPTGAGNLDDTVSILAGGTLTYTLTATVSAGAVLPLLNTATASVPPGVVDLNLVDNTDTDTISLSALADLRVDKRDSADPLAAGQTLTYTLTVTNAGPSDAHGAVLTDSLPLSVTYLSANPAPVVAGQTLVWSFASLPSGNVTPIVVAVAVHPDALGIITNAITITAAAADPLPADNLATETTLVTTQADLTIAKTDSHDPLVAGRSLTYTLTVVNDGPSDARGMVVTDTLPLSVTVTTVDPLTTAQNGRTLVWGNLGTLAPGASRVLTVGITVHPNVSGTITNTAQVGATTPDPDPGDNQTDESTLALAAVAVLALSKSHSPILVYAGDLLTYTLLVINDGPLDAEGVVVTDTLPLSVTSISTDPLTSTQNGRQLVWDLGTLGNGVLETLTIVVRVDGDVSGAIVNRAVVSSLTRDFDLTDNRDQDTTPVLRDANLKIGKADAPDPVLAGRPLTYTVHVTNTGPSDAQAVVVTDTLPMGVTLLSVDPITSAQNGQVLVWSLADMVCHQFHAITVRVLVDSAISGTVTNYAEVTSNTSDANPTDNSTAQDTQVDTQANLAVTKLDLPDPVEAGTTLTYTLIYTNHGPSDAQSVAMTDTLPPSTVFGGTESTTPPLAGPTQAGQRVTWSTPTLAAGASGRVVFTVTVDSGASGTLTNTVTIASGTVDPLQAGNTATETTTVIHRADLSVLKTDLPDPAVAGLPFTYTITVINNGPADAIGVALTDTLPADVTLAMALASQGTYTGISGTWDVGVIVATDRATLTLVVTPHASLPHGTVLINSAVVAGSYIDPDIANNTATQDTTVNRVADLSIQKSDGRITTTPGSLITYTLTIANAGPSDATGLSISDTLPSNTALAPASSTPGWHQVGATDIYTRYIGTLTAGDAISVVLGVTVDASLPSGIDAITNTASVIDTGDNGLDPVPNNTATDVDVVVAAPDLRVHKSDGGITATPGSIIVYVLTYTNTGDQEASGTVLTETVPAHTVFHAAASTPGWSCPSGAPPGTTCTLTVGSLVAGASSSVTFAVLLDTPIAAGVETIANTATIADDGTNGADTTPSNNASADTTPVLAAPDLSLTKDDGVSLTYPGSVLTYTLTTGNLGNQGATGIVLTDVLPAYVSFASASDGGTETAPGSGIVVWPPFSLPGAMTTTRTVVVTVSDPLPFATNYITNAALVFDDGTNGPEPSLLDNADILVTAVEFTPVLSVTKTGPVTACVGDIVVFTFAVTNDSPPGDGSPLDGLSLVDDHATPVHYVSGDDGNWLMEVGEVWVYTASYRISPFDPTPLVNTVTIIGLDGDGDAIVATDTHSTGIAYAPGISLIKIGPDTARVGQTVVYTFIVGNSAFKPTSLAQSADGDGSPIGGIVVTDSIASPAYSTGDDGDWLLEVTEAWMYTATYTVHSFDPDPLTNLAGVTGLDGNGNPVGAADTHSLDIEFEPALHISKFGPVTAQVGDTVVYTLTVTYDDANGDASPISGISVSDDTGHPPFYLGGDDGNGLLEPGETWVYTTSYTVQSSDPYNMTTTYSVEGYDRDGDLIRDAHIYIMDIHGVMRPRIYLPLILRQH